MWFPFGVSQFCKNLGLNCLFLIFVVPKVINLGDEFWAMGKLNLDFLTQLTCYLPPCHWGHQELLSGPLDPTPSTLRSTIWSETILIQSPPRNKSCTRVRPHARNEDMNSLKIHIGHMHNRYMIQNRDHNEELTIAIIFLLLMHQNQAKLFHKKQCKII